MQSHDPTYPLFPIFAFLGFLVSIIPLPWHLQAWNAGTCAFMIWTGLSCLSEFINSIIWRGNVLNVAPVWCDISSKLMIGVGIGIPASTLCISRRLYNITAVQTVSVTREDKRRVLIGDLCIAVGIPVIVMILHVVVQGHRFDILEDIGCYPVVYNTLPAYFLYYLWPVVIGVVSFCYSCLTLRSFWKRRLQFNQLMSSNSSMNASRYFRLMLLAVVDIMCTIPLGVYTIYIATKGVPLSPWISWEDTHYDFGRVAKIPTLFWRGDPSFQIGVELTRWLPVFCALLFFALFGFASEAKKHYALAFWWVAKKFGFNRPSAKGTKASLPGWKKSMGSAPSTPQGSLPAYTPKSPELKKFRPADSFPSSVADTDYELDTYTEIDVDIEKSAGLSSLSSSAPPHYSYPPPHPSYDNSSTAETINCISPQSSKTCLDTKNSNHSLRTAESRDRIYITDVYNEPRQERTRTPSPAPFSNVVVPPFHRPFTPPSVYPVTLPHAGTLSLDAIRVTVHTQSRSTDAL